MRYKGMLIFLLSTSVLADNTDVESDFLKSLTSINEVAATSKLNRDKTTSLINVIQGKKLEKLGVCNVYDALKYIPGIELSKEATGVMRVIFRGSITKGEVKFMVDGVEINNAYRASYYYFLDFPIELISRIEVQRGPYSILHGSGAISGVINIITKSSQDSHPEQQIFAGAGSHKYGKGGARINLKNENYKLSLDAYYQKDDKEIDSTDQHFNDYSVGVFFKAFDFEFNTRLKDSIQGGAYGLFDTIDTLKNKYDNENKTLFSNLKYNTILSENNDINIEINYAQYAQKIEDFSQQTADENPTYSGDIVAYFKERSYSSKLELKNTSLKGNQLLIGLNAKNTETLKTDLLGYPGKSNIVSPNLKREIYSIYLQNNLLLTKDINIDLGLRYDDYSDFGDNTSAELGLVYRADNDLSYKLKHAHAFRAPSWTELYGLSGDDTLEAEISDYTEIGAIYKYDTSSKISLNFYYSSIKDYIQKVAGIYSQEDELTLKGVELDFSYTPKHNIEFDLLSSYTNAEDKNSQQIDQIAPFLTTSSLIYTTDIGLVFGSTLRYQNSKEVDNRTIFDQSISYNYKDLNIKLIVKNLFDSDVEYYDNSTIIKDAKRLIYLKTSWEF